MGPGWGPAGRAELLDTAMSCGDILLHREERETAETSPGREDSLFCPWPCQPSLCCGGTHWRSPACSIPGRNTAHSRDAAPTSTPSAALTCLGSTAHGLGECWWMVLPSGGTQHGSALQKDKETLAQALSDCVIYCKNVPFRGFQEARSHSRPSEISSLSEAKARKLIRDEGEMRGAVAPGDWDRVEGTDGFLVGSQSLQTLGFPSCLGETGSSRAVLWVWLC